MKAYPDNIKEISFLATLDRTAPYRPWFAALGATAYWGIGLFGTRRPRVFDAEDLDEVEPVIDTSTARGAVQYQDAYLVDNDSRFVFSFVRSAIEAGAAVANYVELVSAERVGDRWACRLRDTDTGDELTTSARVVVNAAGPFVDDLNAAWGLTTEHRIVFSKGIHLVVPRLTTTRHDRVLAFFDDTQRLFYVIPMGRRSVIGTTDTRVDTPYTDVTDEDWDFLLGQINARLDLPQPLTRDDVIAERSGVRPLVVRTEGGDQQRRRLDLAEPQARGRARHRARGRHRVRRQAHRLPQRRRGGRRTRGALGIPLEKDLRNWYGEPARATRNEFYRQARLMRLDALRTRPEVEPLSDRLWRRYGRRAFGLLEAIRADPAMGEDVMGSADYLRAELHTAAEHEMVVTLEDFMRRRSKIDLVVPDRDIVGSAGLREVAEILFGDDADRRLADYVATKAART